MKIYKNAFVSLHYTLHTDNAEGPIVEICDDKRPLNFVFGAGRMLPHFEQNIEGLQYGDTFSFSLTPEQAYGERREDAVVSVPKNIFVMDGKLREDLLVLGTRVPMMDDNGQHIVGIVLEVTDNNVTLDFNHPMAGETLFFEGKIVEVREATVEELIGPQHGCGGGCGGNCGGSCGGGCHDEGDEGCCGGDCGGSCHN